MARSKFPKALVREAGEDNQDGQLLRQLYSLALPKALEVAEAALSREVDIGAQMVENEALVLMADLLKDEIHVSDDEYLELKSRIARRIRTKTGLQPDRAEIERHAVAVAQTLVRGWLQHLIDLRKTDFTSDDILPQVESRPGWQEVWDSVASYNVEAREARYILRQMCGSLYLNAGDRISLPRSLSLGKHALEQAIQLSSTITRPRRLVELAD